MTSNEAARLAVYVGVRYGVGVCATPIQEIDSPDGYALDIHLRGNPHHNVCHTFSRGECEKRIDELWVRIFPDIL